MKRQKGDLLISKLAHNPKARCKYHSENNRKNENVPFFVPKEMGMIGRMLDADGNGDLDAGDLLKHGGKVLGKLFGR